MMESIIVRGVKCNLDDLELVTTKLESYLRRIKYSVQKPLGVTSLKKDDPSLYYQLSLYGYSISQARQGRGLLNPQFALEALGIQTRSRVSSERMVTLVGEIIPRSVAEDAYAGMIPAQGLKRRFFQYGPAGKQIYRAFFNPERQDFRAGRFKEVINSLYPDLAEKHGVPLYDALHGFPYAEDYIREKIRTFFYAGKDITPSGLESLPGGKRMVYVIRKRALPGVRQRSLFGKTKNKVKNIPFDQKIVEYLQTEGITADLLKIGKSSVKAVSHIQERQLLFLLTILQKYDPAFTGMNAEWGSYFPPPLTKVVGTEQRKGLQFCSGKEMLEADGRVHSGELEILLEVKGHKQMQDRHIATMLEKYHSVKRWQDRFPIDKKIVLLYNGCPEILHFKQECKKEGWQAMDSAQFTSFYRRGLEILLDKEPDFFSRMGMPALTVNELLDIHDDVSHSSHLLLRRGRHYEAVWVAEFLRQANAYLRTDQRSAEVKIPPEKQLVPFSEFSADYEEKVKTLNFPDTLFLDVETAGYRNTGSPLAVLGMAYEENGAMMTDVSFVRHPREEKQALQHFLRTVQRYGKVVTFNGKTFDEGFLQERLAAHCIPLPAKPYEHIDLHPLYREFARRKGYPRATQQTYERTKLGIVREGEIPGSKIPAAYHDYLYKGDASLIPAMIRHNQMDVITLAFLYKDMMGEK